jgi:hypothetical protein
VSPKFRRGPVDRTTSETPERLFDDLPRTRDGVASLWAHQADLLRDYFTSHLESSDVALELPTGSGKTLPALPIGEWRRISLGNRVLYACPTTQLANQVLAEAQRQGMDAVALHGPHRRWDTGDSAKYERGDALAVCTYSTVFNSNPALSPPQTLIFDDAHSAEQYVAPAWSVSVKRLEDPEVYGQLLQAIAPELSGLWIQRLQSIDPDPNTRADVRLLPLGALNRRAGAIDSVLSRVEGDMMFRYTQIREALGRCLLYFGWEGFLIRPYIPPTAYHPHFTEPVQRVYVSATLGDGGELERAFGRAPIIRLPVPAGWDQRSSGRRFFVFPELIQGDVARAVTRALIDDAGKSLIIAPSNYQLDQSKVTLAPSGMEVFGKDQIETSLDEFRRSVRGVLALANRYDGLDFLRMNLVG